MRSAPPLRPTKQLVKKAWEVELRQPHHGVQVDAAAHGRSIRIAVVVSTLDQMLQVDHGVKVVADKHDAADRKSRHRVSPSTNKTDARREKGRPGYALLACNGNDSIGIVRGLQLIEEPPKVFNGVLGRPNRMCFECSGHWPSG